MPEAIFKGFQCWMGRLKRPGLPPITRTFDTEKEALDWASMKEEQLAPLIDFQYTDKPSFDRIVEKHRALISLAKRPKKPTEEELAVIEDQILYELIDYFGVKRGDVFFTAGQTICVLDFFLANYGQFMRHGSIEADNQPRLVCRGVLVTQREEIHGNARTSSIVLPDLNHSLEIVGQFDVCDLDIFQLARSFKTMEPPRFEA